jgi:cytochrome c biogenesis protein CcmG/thiol:disulfide interchange protein DsbE
MKRTNIGIVILIVVFMICGLYHNRVNAKETVNSIMKEAPRANYLAPSFKLAGLDGKSYRVGGERDKLLLINFWASWCEPCHMEAGDLQSVYTAYKDQLDLYAVNVTYMDSQAEAMDFVSEYELTYPTLLDVSGDVTRDKYWIDGYPTSYLVNQAGVIAEIYFGVIDKSILERDIKKLLVDKGR